MAHTDIADPPIPEWDPDNEVYIIKSGDIIISFYDPGELIVAGHDVTAQVTYDQITEDRGLRFQDTNRRNADYRERLGFGEDK